MKIPPPVIWKGVVTNVCTLGAKLPPSRQTNFENIKTIETRDIKCWGSREIMPHILYVLQFAMEKNDFEPLQSSSVKKRNDYDSN